MQPVAIIGAHSVRRTSASDQRLEELVYETAASALADAGLTRDDLDTVVLATSDELDGRSISSMLTAAPAGALLKDEVKVTDSGLHGLFLGAMRVQSGLFRVGLVISWSKTSEATVAAVQRTALEPFIKRPIGPIDPVASAVLAGAYLSRYGLAVDDLDRRAAAKWAALGRETWGTDAANGSSPDFLEYIAYPLRRGHVAPLADGAAALVLASVDFIASHRLPRPPVWLRGMGWATDRYSLGDPTRWAWSALRRAGTDALRRAGMQVRDIDAFEVDDYTVIHEVLAVEGLGLASPGEGLSFLAATGSSRVQSLSGGGFAGYPLFCAGLWRTAQAVRYMWEHQEVARCLVHGTAGIAGQGHGVVILSSANVGG